MYRLIHQALESTKALNAQLKDELSNANNMLKATTQPYAYIIDTVRQVRMHVWTIMRYQLLQSNLPDSHDSVIW
jgi:hypothetical protein